MFDLVGLEQAREVVAAAMPPTPQYRWPVLCEQLGCEVWVSVEKNQAMKGWGAELIEFGNDFEDARLEAVRRAEAEGALIVPPFHPALVRGVATYALELFSAVAALDAVYVPIGMGSGICGLIRTRDLLGLTTDIIGVVAAEAPAMARSVTAGEVVATDSADTFADGMACRVPMAEPLAIVQKGAARVVEVSEAAIAEAMRALYRLTHNVAEGAGAAALAALTQERARQAGKRVGVVLSRGQRGCGGVPCGAGRRSALRPSAIRSAFPAVCAVCWTRQGRRGPHAGALG